jgi:hypothetical protein
LGLQFQEGHTLIHFKTLRATALALGIVALALPAAADRISVTVNNNLNFEVNEIYIDGNNVANWTSERLQGRTIAPGARREIGIEQNPNNCTYDVWVRQTYSDGSVNDMVTQHELCGSGDIILR